MEEAGNTEYLRSMAPHWNLAGDKKLLSLLQGIHQKIMTRCQETSTKLEEMAVTLDGANIDLQNVNNKFMALSNSQFIESRVYDDDLEVSIEEKPIKVENAAASSQDVESELAKLKQSLMVLESMHESVRIVDSDSESDSDEADGRMVYKPKDLYNERPLPYIIGSQAWKSKWHAGIIAEDSDTDSTTSKPENEVLEQYSESESELTDTRTDRLNPPQRTISSNSSTVDSEPSVPPPPPSQANIAAELARKLAGNLPEIPVEAPEQEQEYTKPRASTSQVYKPQNPPTSTIFFDEPPPIDQSYQSDGDYYNDDQDDDIFAELHKTKPSVITNKDQPRVNQDLFGDFNDTPAVTDDLFGTEHKESTVQKNNDENPKENDKKPIGGISVFGSSIGTESIGAAILKRNQRKTYSSDEESEKGAIISKEHTSKDTNKEKVDGKASISKDIPIINKDILRNAKGNKEESISEKKTASIQNKDILQNIFDKNKQSKAKKDEQVSTKEKADLFSDNLFDDIDDIFTDTIVKVPIKEASKDVKSIFDEEDDDLFAGVAVMSQKETVSKIVQNKTRGLFDSDDDDLFSEDHGKSNVIQKPVDNISKTEKFSVIKNQKPKSIFEDDSEEDIFSEIKIKNNQNEDMKINNTVESLNEEKTNKSNESKEKIKDDDNNNSFTDNKIKSNNSIPQCTTSVENNNVKEATEHVNSTFDNDQLNESSQNSLDVLLTPRKENSIETREINSDFGVNESDHFSKYQKDTVDDDWNDSVTKLKDENIYKTSEDVEPEDSHRIVEESTTADGHESEHFVKSDLNDDMLGSFTNISLPKDNNTTESEKEANSETNSISYNSDNLQLPTESRLAADQTSDIFNDIFNDVPPAFEKPKDSKKSKNVNALFDDDSDDEALFFKKNDVISDEKPDIGPASKEDSLFSIFSDEPPAIDVDFTQSRKHENYDSKQFDLMVPEDSFETLTDKKMSSNNGQLSPSPLESQINEKLTDNIGYVENKKLIGKLKSMNINIDVNALLPGALPKKSKVVEQVDGQVASSESVNKINAEHSEPKIVKSISFDAEADSGLLDNKLSKERAKIQVKRRPSTRRARREAVKKSGIDFVGNDITDNTDIVDHVKVIPEIGALDDPMREIVKDSTKVEKDEQQQNVKSKIVYILNDEDIFSNVNTDNNAVQNVEAAVSNMMENSQDYKTDVPSSDDDVIFKKMNIAKVRKTTEANLAEITQKEKKITIDKSDDIFRNRVDTENQNISIKSEQPIKNKASIFDEVSDGESELFQGKKMHDAKSEQSSKKKNIFGSDSEEELFGSNVKKSPVSKEEMQKPTNVKIEVKKSLFDDDSDDDLFTSKTSSSGSKPHFSKANEVKPIQTQSVDEDPLSILTNEEVNYI